MIIATDQAGKVLLVAAGNNTGVLPDTLNGAALTAYVLTPEQVEQFLALPMARAGAVFDGETFSAIHQPTPTPHAVIISIEQANPATHRGHVREFPLFVDMVLRQLHAKINALDAEIAAITNRTATPLPAIPVTHMIAVIKAVDDAIKAERAKL